MGRALNDQPCTSSSVCQSTSHTPALCQRPVWSVAASLPFAVPVVASYQTVSLPRAGRGRFCSLRSPPGLDTSSECVGGSRNLVGKSRDLETRPLGVRIPALQLTNCVSGGKSLVCCAPRSVRPRSEDLVCSAW